MRKTLVMDPGTREMRLRYEDLYNGLHEVTEYRVTNRWDDGAPDVHVVRNMPEFDGRTVHGTSPDLYITAPAGGGHIPVWTQQTAIGPTVKTACPKAANARRKCALYGH